MEGRFKGKAAVVTGGGAGIGRAAAKAFAAEGAAVAVIDRSPQAGEAVVAEIEAAGGRGLAVRADVASPEEVRNAMQRVVKTFGGIDVLYNNAGIAKYGTVVDMPVEDWDQLMAVNLRAAFLTCKFAIPEMIKRGGGSIVNTASVQAFASQRLVAAYSASKGAIVSFTRTVALDHAEQNIRCNCIAPGSVQTPMLDEASQLFAAADPKSAIREWGNLHPLGRVGTPEEVAKLVLFLASNDASFCTGGCYTIDGGLLSALM